MPSSDPAPLVTRSRPAPSPTATPAKDDLVAALGRLMGAQFRYHLNSNLPEPTGGTVDATGGFDRAGQVYEENVVLAGGKYDDTVLHRVVFGTDSYSRTRDTDKWVHLDLNRLKSSKDMLGVNMDDPTGLAVFITTITEANRTGPHSFKGRFDPFNKERFIPIGYPGVVAFVTGTSPFAVETDEQGNVTSIHIEIEVTDKPKLDSTTTFSDHGKPLATQRPAKNKTGEADDMYYR